MRCGGGGGWCLRVAALDRFLEAERGLIETSGGTICCGKAGAPFELEIAMGFRTILVPIEQHDLMNSTLQTALILARKFDSYIEGFALRVDIPAAFAVGDVSAVPVPPSRQEIAENETRSRDLFEKFMQEQGVPSGGDTKALSSGWLKDAPEGDQFLGSHGRVFDVIVLARPGRDRRGPRMSTLEAALFETGRPILIALPSPQPQMGTNILIAWNCSTEQARATAFAMPVLADFDRQPFVMYSEIIKLRLDGGKLLHGGSDGRTSRRKGAAS
jgi:hypothetical protein